LHKFLLAQDPQRKAIKRSKDRQQAEQVMNLVEQGMPHYPMDEAFISLLSPRLQESWATWEPLRLAAQEKAKAEAGYSRSRSKRSP
jgi:hypothetical protein